MSRVLKIEDVMSPHYMTSEQLCEYVGITMKTLHNKHSAGELPFDPMGKLVFGRANYNIWIRDDVRAWATNRRLYGAKKARGRSSSV